MSYPKSSLKKMQEKCLGIYYDYRKISVIFCCYSLIGTGLILSASSLFGENTFPYSLSAQKKTEHDTLVVEAASSEQNISSVLQRVKSSQVVYSLTGSNSILSKEAEAENTAIISQQEALASTALDAQKDSQKTDKKTSGKKEKEEKLPYHISDYSKKELQILERIVEAEAGDQSVKGRIMVADVILNRVSSKEFPNTIKKVVFQKNKFVYQFSPIKDGRYYDVSISDKTKKAVAKTFESEDLTDGALYFMSRSGSSKKNIRWFDSSLQKITSYGCHEFFK